MLFVSKKETLTSETLPDTSLHNVRNQQAHTESNCCSSSSAFFQSSPACLSKLTKEQFGLHREFLRLGSLLMTENVDLFHHALTLLSAKHDLKVKTPATSVSDVIPPSQIARHYNKSGDFATPRASNRKYVLPKDVAEKEFYQCMVCKERRTANSFGATHTHDGSAKMSIRWYCPICDAFFAVTHRGYHVKSRHSDVLSIAHPESVAEQKSTTTVGKVDPAMLKRSSDSRSSDEDECELASLCPPEKMRHSDAHSPSTESTVSSCSSCFGNCTSEETDSPSVGSMVLSPQSQQDSTPFYDGENDIEDASIFSVLPLQNQDDDLFTPLSPLSF